MGKIGRQQKGEARLRIRQVKAQLRRRERALWQNMALSALGTGQNLYGRSLSSGIESSIYFFPSHTEGKKSIAPLFLVFGSSIKFKRRTSDPR